MTEIRATYSCRKGTAPCERCPENTDNVDVIVAYDGQKTLEDAEKLIYSNVFVQEMNLQNEKYRQKGNYGRIFLDIDEWRASPMHRPCEYLLQIGNEQYHPPVRFLWDAYREFYKWRRAKFPDLFIFIGAIIFSGCAVPHIHERIVFYYKDGDVMKTGIDAALRKAGIELPFPKIKEGRDNNRQITFTDICRKKWLDIVEDKLKISYPDVRLVRPEPRSKPIIKFDRALRLGFGNRQALRNAEKRQLAKIEKLTETLDDLRKKQQTFQSEMDAEDIPKEQILIVKNKINQYEKRLDHAKEKAESIHTALDGR